MAKMSEDDKKLLERLNENPEIRKTIEDLLDIIENESGEIEIADDAEDMVADRVGKMGHDVLNNWAKRHEKKKADQATESGLRPHTRKRIGWYTQFGRVQISERVFLTIDGRRVRPFCTSAHVTCNSYSRALERYVTDFGADVSFERASQKMKEHHGVIIGSSAVRRITLKHAQAITHFEQSTAPSPSEKQEKLVVQVDGSMVPTVECTQTTDKQDARDNRTVCWRECRLVLSRPAHQKDQTVYQSTMGNAEQAGLALKKCAERAGLSSESSVHVVADGALWIANQSEEQFGTNHKFLVDFYHLAEYVNAAATCCAPGNPTAWTTTQKHLLTSGQLEQVLENLKNHIPETCASDDGTCPALTCISYIERRPGQFEYQAAREAKLPIGSGEIESAHRSIVQARLKIPGAWWSVENAQSMVSLRVARFNGMWGPYQKSLLTQPPNA